MIPDEGLSALRGQLARSLEKDPTTPPFLKEVLQHVNDQAFKGMLRDFPRVAHALPKSVELPREAVDLMNRIQVGGGSNEPLDVAGALACVHGHFKALPPDAKASVLKHVPKSGHPLVRIVDALEPSAVEALVADLPRVARAVPPAFAPEGLLSAVDLLGLPPAPVLPPAAALACLHGHFRALPPAAKREVSSALSGGPGGGSRGVGAEDATAAAARAVSSALRAADAMTPADVERLALQLPSLVGAAAALGMLPPDQASHLAALFAAPPPGGGGAEDAAGAERASGSLGGPAAGGAPPPPLPPMTRREAGVALHQAFLALPPRAREAAGGALPAEARPLLDLAEGLAPGDVDEIVDMVLEQQRGQQQQVGGGSGGGGGGVDEAGPPARPLCCCVRFCCCCLPASVTGTAEFRVASAGAGVAARAEARALWGWVRGGPCTLRVGARVFTAIGKHRRHFFFFSSVVEHSCTRSRTRVPDTCPRALAHTHTRAIKLQKATPLTLDRGQRPWATLRRRRRRRCRQVLTFLTGCLLALVGVLGILIETINRFRLVAMMLDFYLAAGGLAVAAVEAKSHLCADVVAAQVACLPPPYLWPSWGGPAGCFFHIPLLGASSVCRRAALF